MIYTEFGWAIARESSLDRPRDGSSVLLIGGGEKSCDWADT
jgi:hypothetical protein